MAGGRSEATAGASNQLTLAGLLRIAFTALGIMLLIGGIATWALVPGITGFRWAHTPLTPAGVDMPEPPLAGISVKTTEDGVATLQFTFARVPPDFRVQKVVFHAKQVGAEVANNSQPSDRVKPVLYDVKIPADLLESADPVIEVDLDLYRTKDEPYVRADVILWYEKPDTQVTLELEPEFFDEASRPMKLTIEPSKVDVKLWNSALRRAHKLTRSDAIEQ